MINTGIVIVQGGEKAALVNELPIVIFGIVDDTNIVKEKFFLIQSKKDINDKLGKEGSKSTLHKPLMTLQRYQCSKVYACALAGDTEAAIDTSLIKCLEKLVTAVGTTVIDKQPEIILAPSFSTKAVIDKIKEIAAKTYAIAILNYKAGETVANAITSRSAGSTNPLNVKDPRIVLCFGHLKHQDVTAPGSPVSLEGLDVHLAGTLAKISYGESPLGKELLEVNGVDVPMSFNIGSETSDPEKLTDLGIIAPNSIVSTPGGAGTADQRKWILWGSRNTSYSEGSRTLTTLINTIRVRDRISILAQHRATKLLGEPCNFTTASLLTESYRQMLEAERNKGNIAGYKNLDISNKTDYAKSEIWHNLELIIWSPTELIGIFLELLSG